MQGLKTYEEKIFVNFQLSTHVPSDNFYRRLRNTLNLTFLRKMRVHAKFPIWLSRHFNAVEEFLLLLAAKSSPEIKDLLRPR